MTILLLCNALTTKCNVLRQNFNQEFYVPLLKYHRASLNYLTWKQYYKNLVLKCMYLFLIPWLCPCNFNSEPISNNTDEIELIYSQGI